MWTRIELLTINSNQLVLTFASYAKFRIQVGSGGADGVARSVCFPGGEVC